MPSSDFINNSNEGYRILVPSKITQNQHPKPKNGREENLMKKGRLTKQEQVLRIKQLLEFVFTFRYATRLQLNLFAQTIMKIHYPQRLIEYTLKHGYLDRYYEPKFKTKIYFLTEKAKDHLFDDKPLIKHYGFEKTNIGENNFTEHSLLVDTYFRLNSYTEVSLKGWSCKWFLRRINEQTREMIPSASFIIADSKKIAVEAVIQHKDIGSLKRMITFYQHEVGENLNYHAVLVVADCTNQYEYLRRALFSIDPSFCSKAFILTEVKMLEPGCCLYQDKLTPIEKVFSFGGIKDENHKQTI